MRNVPSRDVAIYAPHSSTFYDPKAKGGGGAEFQTSQIAKGLAESGLRVAHIVYPIGEVSNPIPGLDVVQRAEYRGKGGPLAKLREAIAVWRALRDADARVYILRGRGMYLVLAPLFARLRRRRVVMSGSNDFDFTPGQHLKTRIAGRPYRWAIRSADTVVCQTEQQRRIAARELPEIKDLSVIPSIAEPAEPTSAEPKAFLWPARIVDYKRPLKYVELAAALPDARFWMVGWRVDETPAELEQEVRRRAAELPNLEFMESRPRGELMESLAEAVAVVVTSSNEGMPNVFLEAWMRSIPVLSLGFDPDGLIEREGVGIAAGDDWGRFADGATRLWSDRKLRGELGAAGRRYVMRNHDRAVVISQWLSTVERLLG
jgi:glycosyltransferase involved in cell wall biosynthesis